MEQKGINHCCGAHLTVTEAAAAAGIAGEELLSALNAKRDAVRPAERRDAPASRQIHGAGPARILDVRGLEPPEPLVRVLEAVEQLQPGERLEILHHRRPLILYPQLDARGFIHETDEPEPGLVRIVIHRAGAVS
jgi:uncharacterized protein (DUF2249 family)